LVSGSASLHGAVPGAPRSGSSFRGDGFITGCRHFPMVQMTITNEQPNKALEPTADGAFTFMITDNITSSTSATPHSAAVAQLGR
jgi:hypothetical protein